MSRDSHVDQVELSQKTNIVDSLLRFLLIFTFLLFFLLITGQILGRYLSSWIPWPVWTEEIARITNIWAVYLGVAIAVGRGTHIRIDLVNELIQRHKQHKRKYEFVIEVFALTFFIPVLYGLIRMVYLNIQNPISTIPEIPVSVIYLGPAIGIAISIGYCVVRITRLIKRNETA